MNFKSSLLVIVMLIASPAWAGWTYITSSEGDAISAGGNLEHFLDYEMAEVPFAKFSELEIDRQASV